jgi:hypothetical protein
LEEERQGFLDALSDLGWRDGQNLLVLDAWADGQRDKLPALAADLVAAPVDLILAGGTAGIQAAQYATSTIPIVMAGLASDPVALGLVASMARPGGNITGSRGGPSRPGDPGRRRARTRFAEGIRSSANVARASHSAPRRCCPHDSDSRARRACR